MSSKWSWFKNLFYTPSMKKIKKKEIIKEEQKSILIKFLIIKEISNLKEEKSQLQILIEQEKKNIKTNENINSKIDKLIKKVNTIDKDMQKIQKKMDKLLQ